MTNVDLGIVLFSFVLMLINVTEQALRLDLLPIYSYILFVFPL